MVATREERHKRMICNTCNDIKWLFVVVAKYSAQMNGLELKVLARKPSGRDKLVIYAAVKRVS